MERPTRVLRIMVLCSIGFALCLTAAKCEDLEPFEDSAADGDSDGDGDVDENAEEECVADADQHNCCEPKNDEYSYCDTLCGGYYASQVQLAECELSQHDMTYESVDDCYEHCPADHEFFLSSYCNCQERFDDMIDCLLAHQGDWYCAAELEATLYPHCTYEQENLLKCAAF